jgi:hypothetical protein
MGALGAIISFADPGPRNLKELRRAVCFRIDDHALIVESEGESFQDAADESAIVDGQIDFADKMDAIARSEDDRFRPTLTRQPIHDIVRSTNCRFQLNRRRRDSRRAHGV